LIKLVHNIYYKEIQRITTFRTQDDTFVQHILMNSKPFQALPKEKIFNHGDVAEEIVFIMMGLIRITIFDGRRNVTVGYSRDGGYFGDFEFYKRTVRMATYHAVQNCSLLSISNSALDDAIDNNIDAGVLMNREFKSRFEQLLISNKSRTLAIDLPSQDSVPFGLAKLKLRNKPKEKPTTSFRQTGLTGKALFKAIGRTTIDLIVKPSAISNLASKAKAAKKVAIGSDLYTDFLETDSSSDDEEKTEIVRGVKVMGDPTKPKIYLKKYLWIDGVLQKSDGTAIEGQTKENEGRMLRILRTNDKGERCIVEEHDTDLSERNLIYHKGPKKQIWDGLVGIMIVYNVLIIPVQMGFNWPTMTFEDPIYILDFICDVLFTMDIFFAFRTTYFDEDEDAIVAVSSMMTKNYLSGWFVIDFLAVLPFFIDMLPLNAEQKDNVSNLEMIRIIRLLRLLKLARLAKLGHYIAKLEDTLGVNPITFDLLKMMLEVAFIGHMLGCVWWASNRMTTHSWVDHPHWPLNYVGDDYSEQYVISLYWSFTTLATVGYGDLVATNMTHRVVVILIMVMGATVFGYIVANVSTLMSDLDQTAAKIKERISEITEFLSEKNCPRLLSGSIVRHFKHVFTQTSAFDEPGILQRLPNRIIRDILLTQHQDKIKKILLFKFVENQSVVLFLFRVMSPLYFEPDQSMLKEGEIGHEVLFIIAGRARVYKAKSANALAEFRKRAAKDRKEEEIKMAQERDKQQRMRRRSSVSTVLSTGSPGKPIISDISVESVEQQESNLTTELGELHEGDFIGHVALMYAARHSATCRAITNCTAYCMTRFDVQRIVRNHPGVALVLQMSLGEAIFSLKKEIGKSYSRSMRGNFLKSNKLKFEEIKSIKEELAKKNREMALRKNSIPSGGGFLPSFGLPLSKLGRMGSGLDLFGKKEEKGSIYVPSTGSEVDDDGVNAPKNSPVRVIKRTSTKTVSVSSSPLKSVDHAHSESEILTLTPQKPKHEWNVAQKASGATDMIKHKSNAKFEFVAFSQDPTSPGYNEPSRRRARARWNIIKKAIEDARVTATVAGMTEARENIKAELRGDLVNRKKKSAQEEELEQQERTQRRMNNFARAMQARVGEKVAMMLDDRRIFYDSDDDENKIELFFLKKKAKKERHRSFCDLNTAYHDAKNKTSAIDKPLRPRRQSFPSFDHSNYKDVKTNLFII